MFTNLWHTYLYDPLLNLLIFLYNGSANRSLGLALIEFTVLIRVFLLPFTVLSLRASARFDRLRRKVARLEETHKNDRVARKEAIRRLMERHHINPWAKASALGIQFLILIILYRVFITAVRGHNFEGLYSWNIAPDFLLTHFFGVDLAVRSLIFPAIVGFILYAELRHEQRAHAASITNRDVAFRLIFPLIAFALLYALPAGKSIFVLTSVLFTVIMEGAYHLFMRGRHPLPEDDDEDSGSELIE